MTSKLKIMSVVGARPNFMKIAPFARVITGEPDKFEHFLVHTGQHYDRKMSESFFTELGIPPPNVDLGIGSGSHAEQVGRTMIEFEKAVRQWKPDWVVVVGDVNATCACSITAKKEHAKLAHIEAGLRSFDLTMPEEINRMVADRLSDLLFTTDEIADRNLLAEGTAPEKIRRVGNVMIDTLERHRQAAAALPLERILATGGGETPKAPPHLKERGYAVLTMHRPSNVDHPEILARLVDFLAKELGKAMPIVWPLHPRTRKQLMAFQLWPRVAACDNLVVLDPLGYQEMLRLNLGAAMVLTDSGGLQEECCVLGTPCVVLRENTERPITLREHGGLCALAGNDVARIRAACEAARGLAGKPVRPPLWDGHAAERIGACFRELAT